MPYPFVLPTTSAFSFAAAFTSPTHPSLLRNASIYRGVMRDTLKRYKRLPPESQAAHLGLVVSSLNDYLPYLFAIADGLAGKNGIRIDVGGGGGEAGGEGKAGEKKDKNRADKDQASKAKRGDIEWRPVLLDSRIPGKEPPRVRISVLPGGVGGIDAEVALSLSVLGHAYTLQARAALHPLYIVTSVVPVSSEQRLAAINAASKHLLAAAGVFLTAANYVELSASSSARSPQTPQTPPEIGFSALRALSSLALAEATLLTVLKDDPYPAVVAQDRNEHDREWMYKAPDIPRVRAHLFARLCLAASEHVAGASAAVAGSRLSSAFVRYLEDLRHTSRAKACRFFAIDADLGKQTGTALAYIHAALQELDADVSASGAGGGSSTKNTGFFGRLRRERSERSEKREDRRAERGVGWGGDAGRFEEARVLSMLDVKWTKQNDTMNTQLIPPAGPLLAQMPSGRDIHTVKPMATPSLDASVLEALRAPPDPLDVLADEDGLGGESSSDDDDDGGGQPGPSGTALAGAYPGTQSTYY